MDKPSRFPRIDDARSVQPRYAVWQHELDELDNEIERLRKALEDIGMEPSEKDKHGIQNYDAAAYELRQWARDALDNK